MTWETSSLKKLYKIALISAAAVFIAAVAQAACTVSTTPVNFAAYDVFVAAPVASTGTVTVVCTNAPPVIATVTIGPSTNSGGFNPRQMRHLTLPDLLNYNLYLDAAMLTIWGDGTLGTAAASNKVKKNNPWVSTIYGRIPAGQDVTAGAYRETLTVTVLP